MAADPGDVAFGRLAEAVGRLARETRGRDRTGTSHQDADDITGTVATDAPTAAQVQAAGYVGAEPLSSVLELIGASVPTPDGGTVTLQRPSAKAGSLAAEHGTLTTIVSFSEDVLVPAQYLGPLYEYLTGDKHDRLYKPVVAPDAVHEMLIANPGGLLDAIRPML